MSQTVAETAERVDTAPHEALFAVIAHDGPLVIDLDETLYLRNSTEDFIDCARPGLVALLVLRLLDLAKPWRWTGGAATRDVWRVRAILTLLPWTAARWRQRVAALAAAHTNRPLLEALRRRSDPPVVATLGFRPIVAPLLAAMGLADAPLVAVADPGFDDRRRGKLAMVQQAIGADAVRRALVLTDSPEDAPLLACCARPLLIVWPAARFRRALERVYLPGQYLSLVKRPGERYIVRSILQEDFAYWLLASIGLAAVPGLHAFGLLFLLLSFWTIYELGYVDNDVAAERYEKAPKLTAAYHRHRVATPTWTPWGWALGAAAVGIMLLRWPAAPLPMDFAKWLAVLLTTFAWFRIYNRYDKATRVWLFAGLQLARVAAFAVLVPVMPIGAVALAAHAMSRWVPYHTYRASGGNWPDTRPQTMRLMFFVILAALLSITQGHAVLFNWTALAVLGWSLYRARHELADIRAASSRIDRPVVESAG